MSSRRSSVDWRVGARTRLEYLLLEFNSLVKYSFASTWWPYLPRFQSTDVANLIPLINRSCNSHSFHSPCRQTSQRGSDLGCCQSVSRSRTRTFTVTATHAIPRCYNKKGCSASLTNNFTLLLPSPLSPPTTAELQFPEPCLQSVADRANGVHSE